MNNITDRKYFIIAIIISLIGIVISASAAFPFDINTNKGSFVLGVLTALVTILIGWNIFSLIDFNKKKEDLDKQNAIIAKTLLEMRDRQFRLEGATENSMADLYYHLMGLKHPYPKEFLYINHCVCAIMKFSQTGDYHICNALTNTLLQIIIKPEDIYVPLERKKEMLTFIHNIKSHDKIDKYTELVSLIIHLSESSLKE